MSLFNLLWDNRKTDGQVVEKMTKHTEPIMKPIRLKMWTQWQQNFLLGQFECAYISIKASEDACMWYLFHFMSKYLVVSLTNQMSLQWEPGIDMDIRGGAEKQKKAVSTGELLVASLVRKKQVIHLPK